MAILKVARMGHPVLRARARPIDPGQIGTPRLQQLIDDMFETMQEYQGVGLAAPQVHESLRLFVAGFSPDDEDESSRGVPLMALINPEILELGDERQTGEEGCLSIPDIFADVERPAWVHVRYIDRDGKLTERRFEGRPAVILQHEVDHLNGVLFIDHLSKLRRDLLIRKFRKSRKDETA